jgi:hypothetical protein
LPNPILVYAGYRMTHNHPDPLNTDAWCLQGIWQRNFRIEYPGPMRFRQEPGNTFSFSPTPEDGPDANTTLDPGFSSTLNNCIRLMHRVHLIEIFLRERGDKFKPILSFVALSRFNSGTQLFVKNHLKCQIILLFRPIPTCRLLQEVSWLFFSSIRLQAIPWLPVQEYQVQPTHAHRSRF